MNNESVTASTYPDSNVSPIEYTNYHSLSKKLSAVIGSGLSVSLLFGCTTEAKPTPIDQKEISSTPTSTSLSPRPNLTQSPTAENTKPSVSAQPEKVSPPDINKQEEKAYRKYIEATPESYKDFPETEKGVFGAFLRKKYSLDLPYVLPRSPKDASPEGLIDNYNYNLSVALPKIAEQGTINEAVKYLYTFMSPQEGDNPGKNDVAMRATLIEGYLTNELMDFSAYADNNVRSLSGNNGDPELYPTKNAVAISTAIAARPDDPYSGLRMYFSFVETEQGYDAPLISVTQ